MMRILIVVRDRSLAQKIQSWLCDRNCTIHIAPNGDMALQMVGRAKYDRILLDNIGLYQHLRAQGCQSQILLLISPGEEWQKAIALNVGINDYLVQPFEAEELRARLEQLPKSESGASISMTWGLLTLDLTQQQVSYDHRPVNLTAREYSILELLLRAPDRSVSSKAIADRLSISREAVNREIRELRQKLTNVGAPPDAIAAIRGLGYQLTPIPQTGVAQSEGFAIFGDDITERQPAEIRRSESAELLQVIIENLPGGAVFIFDRDLRYVLAEGPALYRANFQPADLVGKTIFEVLEPELAELYSVRLGKALAGEQFYHEHDAHGRFYLSRGTPWLSSEGEIDRVLVFSYDITDRQRAETLWHQSQEREVFLLKLSDVLRPLADPIAIQYRAVCLLGEYLGANRVGYAEDGGDGETVVVTRNYTDSVPNLEGRYRYDDYGSELLREFRAGRTVVRGDIANDPSIAEEEKSAHAVLQLGATVNVPLVKNGSLVAIFFVHYIEAHPWSAEEVKTIQDVADRTWAAVERAKAEAALHLAQQKLEIAVEAAEMGTWYLDLTRDVSPRRSPRHDRIFGYDTPQAEWGEAIARRHVIAEDRDIFDAAFARARETGELNFEARLQWPDGSIHWMAVRGRFYFDANGNPLYGGGVNFDITERKQVEAALQDSEAQLAAELAATQQLQRLSTQLIPENNIQNLYEQILDAAIAIARSDLGSIQIYYPERNLLHLLLHRGFDPASAALWEWVGVDGNSIWGRVLASKKREIVPDVQADERIVDPAVIEAFRRCGIRAVQSTPLISRDGSIVGMFSNHWREPHEPSERELNLIDVLARQAADLIERARNQQKIESDLRDTQLLHALATRLVTEDEPQSLYQEILETAIALMGADGGTIQILDRATGEAIVLAHQGFDPYIVEHFHRVSASSKTSCGRALATGDRVFVDFDVPESEDPDGLLRLLFEVGYLRAQSTPLISRSGQPIGVVSTHWRSPYRPSDRELRFLDLLARQAADTIEQHNTAAALREREELLRTITEAGLWTWDVVTDELTWSPEMYSLHGLDPNRPISTYQNWLDNYLHPEERPAIEEYIVRLLAKRPSQTQVELRIVHPQDGMRWLLGVNRPIWSDRGELLRISGIVIDITARKQSQIALEESESKLRQILNSTIAAVVQFHLFRDGTWQYNYFSEGCEALYGYAAEELMADPMLWVSRVFPEDRENRLLPVAQKLLTEENLNVEYRFYHRDGSLRWISTSYQSRQIALDCWEVTAIAQDISDRKLAEEALRESEAKFRHFAENSHTLIWMAEPTTLKPTYVSPAYEGIWGKSAESLIEYPESWIDGIHPEDRDRVRTTFIQERRQPSSKLEYRIVRPDGTTRWICDWGFPIRNEAGEIYSYGGIAEDITERKEAELALRESEARFAAAFTHAAIGMTLVDLGGRFVQVNRALCEIVGYTEAELLSLNTHTITHPDDWEIDWSYGQQLLRGEIGFYHLEKRYIHKLGHIVWILLSGSVVRDEAGQPLYFIGQIQDITQRKLAEEALRQSEARFAASFNYAAIGMTLVDLENKFIQVNQALCDITGYSKAELVGRDFCTITHPDDLQTDLNYRRQLRGGKIGFFHMEKRYLHKRSHFVWTFLSVSLVRDEKGQPLYFIAQIQDINNRKLAETRIQEQAALLDVASDAIFVRDVDNRILYWNRGAERLYGWTSSEAVGQKANELLQEKEQEIEKILQNAFEAEEWRGEMQKVTKSGAQVTVAGCWSLVKDEAGCPKYILCVNTNITEKKELEAQFYRAQRLESVGTLASGIAHDLNNVLTPIVAMTRLLLKQSHLDARSQEMLKLVESSAQKGTETIKRLLSFSKGSQDEGERAPVDFAALLQEAVEICQRTFSKKIAIESKIPDASNCWVSANAAYLHQVLMNLCVNARDAMPSGGTLSLSVEGQFVDEDLVKTNLDAKIGRYVLLTVTDTGTGMPQQVVQRIFDPFFTTKEPGKGTGLGLPMVLRIVKDCGGFLTVSSSEGKGTEFKIYLPAISSGAALRAIDPPQNTQCNDYAKSEPSEGKVEGILVVDDDVTVLRSTQALLESNSYKVFSANEGAQALKVYARHRHEIEAIVLDIMMPKMSGIELIEKIREIDARVNIVALSGVPANREPAIAVGANIFLSKPYTLEDLLESVRAVNR